MLNKCVTKILKNKVLGEVWSGKKQCVSHLKMLGSIYYRNVFDARKRKLDDKSEHIILVGYHKTEAYRLFNPINVKMLVSSVTC